MTHDYRIGVSFPQVEIGKDRLVIRDFAQAIEGMGFSHLTAYDHVVGADRSVRPDWQGLYDIEDMFHEPLILFAYLAGLTRKLEFMSALIPLPQRQAVLFAKQAATLANLSGDRLKLGVGLGWNDVEYQALGVDFHQRAPIFEEQIALLRKLWAEHSVTFSGRFHHVPAAGINPLPERRSIPVYIGAIAQAAVRRAARIGDGWLSVVGHEEAGEAVRSFRALVAEFGRDPDSVAVEADVHLGASIGGPIRTVKEGIAMAQAWRDAGSDGVAFDTMKMGFTSIDQHLALLRELAGGLGLKGL